MLGVLILNAKFTKNTILRVGYYAGALGSDIRGGPVHVIRENVDVDFDDARIADCSRFHMGTLAFALQVPMQWEQRENNRSEVCQINSI